MWRLDPLVAPAAGIACRRCAPRGQIIAFADNLLYYPDREWGPAVHVWPPVDVDGEGRRWWQVDYRGTTEVGTPRAVLVDAETGWARFPPPDMRLRAPVTAEPEALRPAAPVSTESRRAAA